MDVIISQNQQNRLGNSLTNLIKTDGLNNVTKLVGGYKNLFGVLNVNTPMDFLHLFDDLDIVESEVDSDYTLFRYVSGYNLMILIIPIKDYVYININWDEIWSVLWGHFKLPDDKIRKLTEEWISEVYNLKNISTTSLRNDELIKIL
jgi:hypothetical protein